MTTCTPETLAEVVARYGVLRGGAHKPEDGDCCILEAVSVCRGVPWTDDPEALDEPDVRALNDAPWSSDELRTAQMLRLGQLLAAWPTWDKPRRLAYVGRVVLRTVREILPPMFRAFGLEAAAVECERADDLAVAETAGAVKRDALLAHAVDIWTEEAQA